MKHKVTVTREILIKEIGCLEFSGRKWWPQEEIPEAIEVEVDVPDVPKPEVEGVDYVMMAPAVSRYTEPDQPTSYSCSTALFRNKKEAQRYFCDDIVEWPAKDKDGNPMWVRVKK